MTEAALLLALVGVAALVAAAGDEVARFTTHRTGWLAAGPFLLIAASPLVPNYTVAFGFSLDDVLPLLGAALMLPLVPWERIRAFRWRLHPGPVIALVGIVALIAAGLLSAVLVGHGPVEIVRLAIRGSGRVAFLLFIVICLAILGSARRHRLLSAIFIAIVGSLEASFGLIAYFVGLPERAGLEAPRQSTVLFGEVPGRISGTLGISPNFTAAILMISALVTAGLALRAAERRERLMWWASVVLQVTALALTYTRVSLGLVLIGLAVLILLRSRPILLLPIAVVVVPIAALTPTLQRFVSDVPDRLALWTSAFLLMIDHPITGVGAGQMREAVALDPARYQTTVFGPAWSTAHNTILLAGAEMGVIAATGAIILNIGLAVVVVRAFRGAPRGREGALTVAAALALGAFLVQGMVNNLFTVGVTGVFAAFLLGTQLLEAHPVAVSTSDGAEDVDVAVHRGWAEMLRGLRARRGGTAEDPSVGIPKDVGGT